MILATETCAYPGANSVGQAHSSYPANSYILRVRSPALFPETFYMDCFRRGISPRSQPWAACLRPALPTGPKDIVGTITEAGAAAIEASNYLMRFQGENACIAGVIE